MTGRTKSPVLSKIKILALKNYMVYMHATSSVKSAHPVSALLSFPPSNTLAFKYTRIKVILTNLYLCAMNKPNISATCSS